MVRNKDSTALSTGAIHQVGVTGFFFHHMSYSDTRYNARLLHTVIVPPTANHQSHSSAVCRSHQLLHTADAKA